MGFFSDFFGGTDKSAQKKTIKDNKERKAFIQDMRGQARGDLLNYMPIAQDNANMGFQSGLDVYGQTIPQMFDVFQQGNVGAQNQLIAGMPQVNNAILGLPVDYSAFQPTQISYNTDYAQQQLPDFISVGDALGGQGVPQTQVAPGGSGFNPGGYNQYFYNIPR